ncbi:BMP family ABC transporter substrate-binding protein [Ostreibacterium oceani]|uniref:BMP family ABC transporter substrate-binding protein n=1 Tax=Ostreibacterium oceani TaxID=2654998 RepID=A0A6N7ERJ9_9GAMM|nr:BMP family ABC transporter substrate-binding protein [Ostreibacterium oceani]MPV85161.1 BMP family ABC transporter substrate-binding protein [Ostreibacterium oceani]
MPLNMPLNSLQKILFAMLSSIALTFASATEESVETPLKIGFVYVGPVGDFGWSYQHDQGRQAIEEKFGDRVKTTFIESVKEGADAERVITQLANDGHGLIFTTSFGYMNPTVKVAKRFPDVKFEHATGYKRETNLATYSSRFYEGRYIAGMLAGAMTENNTIGYVASYPIPEVIRGINSTLLGARRVNPAVTIKVVWVNSWYDPAKETEAAQSLVNSGVDILMQHVDSPAVPQTGEKNDIWVVGNATDMREFAPTKQLTAIIDDWDSYYIERVQAALDGTWQNTDTWRGFDATMVELASFNENIPADIVAQAEAVRAEITAKSFHPFTGPIINRDGETVVAAGEILSDEALLKMNYFIDGIEGDLPK